MLRHITLLRLFLGFILAACVFAPGCAPKTENVVAAYLQGAERQVETSGQRDEIRKALGDLLALSPVEAQSRRYADYQGNAGAWTSMQLLQRYYLPTKPVALAEDRFYRDVGAPEGRTALERCLAELK